MSSRISIESIVEATLNGIKKSQKKYESWSGGEWLWKAPEYMITTNVAEEISKISGPKFLTLENSAKSALDDAGAGGRGKINNKIRPNGRFDILLWWGKGDPRALIEIKNQISKIDSESKKDLVRIQSVLNCKSEESTFQFGIFAFYTSTHDARGVASKDKLEARLKTILEEARQILPDNDVTLKHSKIVTDEDSAWVGGALLIK